MNDGYLWIHLINLQTQMSLTELQFPLLSVQKDKQQKVDACLLVNLLTQKVRILRAKSQN